MIKTLNRTLKQDREKFTLPKNVQDIIPVQSVYPDGIFQTGKNKHSDSRTSTIMWRLPKIKRRCSSDIRRYSMHSTALR